MKVCRLALCILALVASAVAKSPIQQAPARTVSAVDPLENHERAQRAGAKLYARECASCHGSNAAGNGKALPLAAPEVREAAPGALFWVLTNGSLVRGMPSFAHLPAAQRWQIVEYLKTLR
jgi:mono/diheme cytochrome c family protein